MYGPSYEIECGFFCQTLQLNSLRPSADLFYFVNVEMADVYVIILASDRLSYP
jgi:hypothetical protein